METPPRPSDFETQNEVFFRDLSPRKSTFQQGFPKKECFKGSPYLEDGIPVSKWLTPNYKPFWPFGRGTTRSLRDLLTMVTSHLQVLG